MEKAGLRFVRAFHADWPHPIPGDEHGDVEYAITRAEWDEDRLGGSVVPEPNAPEGEVEGDVVDDLETPGDEERQPR